MARIRSIKPEFWGDRKLARLVSRDARLLYIGLWNHADEHARIQGDSRYIKGHCFPYDDDLDETAVNVLVDELVGAKRAVRYEFEGDPYLFLPKLAKHQRLEPAKVSSRLPEPPDLSVEPTSTDPDPSPAQIFSDERARIAVQQVAGSRLPVAGGKGQVAGPRDADNTAPDPTSQLLIEHVNAYTTPPPPKAIQDVKVAIMSLVAQGTDQTLIRNGLTRMRQKQLGPALLPSLVAESIPTTDRPKPRPSTTDAAVAQGLALVDRYSAKGIAQ